MQDYEDYQRNYNCRLLNEVQYCQPITEPFQKCTNKIKQFCVRSPYGNIQSLNQKGRVHDILDSINLDQSNINKYGKYSLEALQNMMSHNKNIKLQQKVMRNREQQITNDLIKYQQTQKKINYYKNHPQRRQNQQIQTSFARNIPQYPGEFVSPPSYLPQQTMKKNKQSYAKQQDILKNMSEGQRRGYAEEKLKQLEEIKLTYRQNNGNDEKFLDNLNNLQKFYQKLRFGIGNSKESRLKTPIAGLKDLETSTVKKNWLTHSEVKPRVEEVRVNPRSNYGSRVLNNIQTGKRNNPVQTIDHQYHPISRRDINYQDQYTQQYPQQYQVPMPYNSTQPIIIMPPPYYPPPSHNNKYQKSSIEQTNLMNRLEKLLRDKQKQSQMIQHPNTQIVPLQTKQLNHIRTQSNPKNQNSLYLVQKFNNGLLPQQRVLQALQRQQVQQLKMLSKLPPDLQKVKMDLIKQTTQLRSQVQKQIHQQRVLRMRHQLQMQEDHQQQMYQDQIWVDKQRKKQVSQKLIQDYDRQQ